VYRRRKKGSISELRKRLNEYEASYYGTSPGAFDYYPENGENPGEKKEKSWRNLFSWSWKRMLIKTGISLLILLSVLLLHNLENPAADRVVHNVDYLLNWDLGEDVVSRERIEVLTRSWREKDLFETESSPWEPYKEHESEPEPELEPEREPVPLPLEGKLLSEYGMREHPTGDNKEMHYGIDIKGKTGEAVRVPWAGVVDRVAGGDSGYKVLVRHRQEWSTVYRYLQELESGVGEIVEGGEVLGRLSEPALWEEAHLHFELRWRDRPVDPLVHIEEW